ncbi:MAG: hydroxyacylglutathione hydrolase [Myxococcales bacterium]|nr:hydroxyacylglutathione hydrolase [Myxococcales bacterium]
MRIVTVPCRSDNYAYLLICEETKKAAVVDPSEAAPVLAAIDAAGVTCAAIWNTHHHYDHIEGNEAIAKKFSECEVVGHKSDRGRIPSQTSYVGDGDELTVGTQIRARVLFNPGHTAGAISYFLESSSAVFTGDTLFAAGCGRLFEGTTEQMHASLTSLTELPPATRVYCGHEYTESNLRFAAAVEPDNVAIAERIAAVEGKRAEGIDTMGFSVADELATNVFVRTDMAQVRESARRESGITSTEPSEIFAGLRAWKDRL